MEITFNLEVHAKQFYQYVSDRFMSTRLTLTSNVVKTTEIGEDLKRELHELAEYFAGPWNYKVSDGL